MFFVKIAWASLKYHRKTTILYLFFLSIAFFLLFIFESLENSIPYLYQNIKQLLLSSGYTVNSEITQDLLQKPALFLIGRYQLLKRSLLLLIAFILIAFSFIYQKVNEKERSTWQQTGSSTVSWIWINLLQGLLPLLFLTACFILFYLLFQQHIIQFILNQQIRSLEFFIGNQTSSDQLVPANLDQIIIRFPKTNHALIQSILLPNRVWNHVLLLSTGQVLRRLFCLICSLQLITVGIYHFWREKWHNKLF